MSSFSAPIVALTGPVHKVAGTDGSTNFSTASIWSSQFARGVVPRAHDAKLVRHADGRSDRTLTSYRRPSNRVTLTRPLGIQLLAALLTIYTMSGFLLAMRVVIDHDDRYRWWMIVAAGAAFAIASGAATLAVWRVEKRGPLLLVGCGALGSILCLTLPAAVPSDVLAPGMWRAAIQGALLILAFLLLAAWYVRNVIRSRA